MQRDKAVQKTGPPIGGVNLRYLTSLDVIPHLRVVVQGHGGIFLHSVHLEGEDPVMGRIVRDRLPGIRVEHGRKPGNFRIFPTQIKILLFHCL